MYLVSFYNSTVKNNKVGKKWEGNWVQWERFYDLEVSLFPPLLQQPAGIHTGFHWFREGTSCPLLHTPDLCPISRSQGNPLLFPQGDYGAGQMASRMHLGTAVASAHSSQRRTHTRALNRPKHTSPAQNISSSGTNRKGTRLPSFLHRFCPVLEIKYLENKPHNQHKSTITGTQTLCR